MSVMAVAGARPALAQITEQVNMTDANNDFEFYDQVNKNAIGPDGLACTARTIPNNNNPSDPNYAANQFCATSFIRTGDSVEWFAPPPAALAGGDHGTESGLCTGLNCSPIPSTPYWIHTSAPGPSDASCVTHTDGSGNNSCPFTVSSTPFNTAGVYTYFCTVHLSGMTGTVIVQDYSLSISPAAQWVYAGAAATFNGTATALPNATLPAPNNSISAAYASQVGLSFNGANQPLNVNNLPASVLPTTAGAAFSFTDSGEISVKDYDMQVLGSGLDPSSLKHNSNDPVLHVVQLVVGAVSPSSVTIAPTDAVGKQATLQVTANGTFPGSLVPTCNITGAPANVNCAFSTITPGPSAQTVTMTITTNGAPSGTYSASVVIAPGGGLAQKSSAFTLVIEDFTDVLTSAATQTIPPGGNAIFTGTVTPVGGYAGTISFACQPGAPVGATCSGPNVTLPGGGAGNSANYTVTFADTSFLGTQNFNIVASGPGPVVHSIPVTVNVGGFSLGSPSITTIGDTIGNPSQTMTFQIIPTGVLNSSVTLTCTSGTAPTLTFPTNATCQFYPSNVIAVNSSPVTVTLVVTTTSSTTANTYNFNVHGVGGGSSSDLALKLNVMAGASNVDLGLVVTATTNPSPLQLVGAPLQMNFKVTNSAGSSVATTATVLINFSVPVQSPVFKDGATTLTCSGTGPYTCTTPGTVAINSSQTITATFAAPFTRSITATGQLSSPNTDTNAVNNNASLASPVLIVLRPNGRKGLPTVFP